MLERTKKEIDKELEGVFQNMMPNPVLTVLRKFGLTTASIGEELGIDRSNVSRYATGKAELPLVHIPVLHDLIKECVWHAEDRLAALREQYRQVCEDMPLDPLSKLSMRLYKDHAIKDLVDRIAFAREVLHQLDLIIYIQHLRDQFVSVGFSEEKLFDHWPGPSFMVSEEGLIEAKGRSVKKTRRQENETRDKTGPADRRRPNRLAVKK